MGVGSVVMVVMVKMEVGGDYRKKENGGGDGGSVLGKCETDGEVGGRAVKVHGYFASHKSW